MYGNSYVNEIKGNLIFAVAFTQQTNVYYIEMKPLDKTLYYVPLFIATLVSISRTILYYALHVEYYVKCILRE